MREYSIHIFFIWRYIMWWTLYPCHRQWILSPYNAWIMSKIRTIYNGHIMNILAHIMVIRLYDASYFSYKYLWVLYEFIIYSLYEKNLENFSKKNLQTQKFKIYQRKNKFYIYVLYKRYMNLYVECVSYSYDEYIIVFTEYVQFITLKWCHIIWHDMFWIWFFHEIIFINTWYELSYEFKIYRPHNKKYIRLSRNQY